MEQSDLKEQLGVSDAEQTLSEISRQHWDHVRSHWKMMSTSCLDSCAFGMEFRPVSFEANGCWRHATGLEWLTNAIRLLFPYDQKASLQSMKTPSPLFQLPVDVPNESGEQQDVRR